MNIQLNRAIGYTYSWKHTLYIVLILSIVFCSILIFLQPFDTYQTDIPNKNLKLMGYAIPIGFAIILLHFIENLWFQKLQKWRMFNEIVSLFVGLIVITLFSFIYLNLVVNQTPISIDSIYDWFLDFGLPFTPFMLFLWAYLRFRFALIELPSKEASKQIEREISGENTDERFTIALDTFLYAKAQSNYVDIIILEKNHKKKIVIRSSFSRFIEQFPEALQVHRSYCINLDRVMHLEGNTRKGFCRLEKVEEPIPVSPKHFSALKKSVQTRPS